MGKAVCGVDFCNLTIETSWPSRMRHNGKEKKQQQDERNEYAPEQSHAITQSGLLAAGR